MLLRDKVIVVTGGAGLLGQQLVKGIIENSGTAVIADIDLERAKSVEMKLQSLNFSGKIMSCQLDITSKKSIQSLINSLIRDYGRIDGLVNNAYPRNKQYGKSFEDVGFDSFCENINLNIGGYFLMCQQFCKYFSQQEEGNIVNISSIYGVIAPRFELYSGTDMTVPVEYSVIKSGLIHMTKYIAKYYKNKNIRVNCISPGGLLNNQSSHFIDKYNKYGINKGMLDAEDIKDSCVYLLSDMSKYVNGQNIIIDDGVSL